MKNIVFFVFFLCFGVSACNAADKHDNSDIKSECRDVLKLFSELKGDDIYNLAPDVFLQRASSPWTIEAGNTTENSHGYQDQLFAVKAKQGIWLKGGFFEYEITPDNTLFSRGEFQLESTCFSPIEKVIELAVNEWGVPSHEFDDEELGIIRSWGKVDREAAEYRGKEIEISVNRITIKVEYSRGLTIESDEE